MEEVGREGPERREEEKRRGENENRVERKII